MGYRSHVVILMYGHPDALLALRAGVMIRAEGKPDSNVFESANDGEITEWKWGLPSRADGTQDRCIRFEAPDTKWYETYAEVQAWVSLFDYLDEQEGDEDSPAYVAYEFVRIGEDSGDFEHRTSDYNLGALSISSTIEENEELFDPDPPKGDDS